jgi:nicotinate dehydrogenase subunit B
MLRMPIEHVRCIHAKGSGCYGHNGADDAAADAALLARALPGRPVRLKWMREQEHAWEPFGPAMVVTTSSAGYAR